MSRLLKPMTMASLVLAIVGLALSLYLSYVHYNLDALVCSGGGCEIVQTSRYSEMFGIPIAFMGVAMFLALIGAIVYRELQPEHADLITTGMVVILLTAVIYWAYLTYVELYVINAVCQWCVITSIATLLLLIIESYRWYQNYQRLDTYD